MNKGIAELSLPGIARIAGFGYLIIFFTGFFANFFVLESLVVPGNAASTAHNILANGLFFRFGIISFIIMVIFDIVLAWALFLLLKPVSHNISLFTAWFRLINGALFGIALYHLLGILQILSGADYLKAFDIEQIGAQAMLSLNAFNDTWLLGLVFFGIHLFFLGYLILRSNYIPHALGVLLIIASLGYLIDSFGHFLLANYTDFETVFTLIVIVPGVIGELSFTLWLLFKGGKLPATAKDL